MNNDYPNRHRLLTLADITTERIPELTKGTAPIILLGAPYDIHALIDLIRDCNAKGRPIETGSRGPIVL
jgi:hypothetical protein